MQFGQGVLTLDLPVANAVAIAIEYIGILCAAFRAAEWVVDSRGAECTVGDTIWVGAARHHGGADVIKDGPELGTTHEAYRLIGCGVTCCCSVGCGLPAITATSLG